MPHSHTGLRWQTHPMNLTLVHQRKPRPSLNLLFSFIPTFPPLGKRWPVPVGSISSLPTDTLSLAPASDCRWCFRWACLQPFSLGRLSLSSLLHSYRFHSHHYDGAKWTWLTFCLTLLVTPVTTVCLACPSLSLQDTLTPSCQSWTSLSFASF